MADLNKEKLGCSWSKFQWYFPDKLIDGYFAGFHQWHLVSRDELFRIGGAQLDSCLQECICWSITAINIHGNYSNILCSGKITVTYKQSGNFKISMNFFYRSVLLGYAVTLWSFMLFWGIPRCRLSPIFTSW